MKSRIVFIDIDGVLNNLDSSFDEEEQSTVIEDYLIKYLRDIENVDYVLISSWSENWLTQDETGQYIDSKFKENGLNIAGTIEITHPNIYRGNKVKKYITEHNIDSYAIVDDYHFDYRNENLSKRFVYIDREFGIQQSDIERIKKILNEDFLS